MSHPAQRADGRRRFTRALAALVSGPLVFMLYFAFAYGAHSLLCALPGDPGRMMTWLLLIGAGISLAVLAAMAMAVAPGRAQDERRFESRTACSLILLSAVAVVWTGAAAAFITRCALLR
jgi:hypothetical protein